MMPFPPDVVRILVAGFVLFGFFGVAYLREKSLKSKVIYLLMLGIVLVSMAGIWLAMSSATILSETEMYASGRPVNILVSVFGMPYVGGTFVFQSGPYPLQKNSGFSIFRLAGSTWEEVNVGCPGCSVSECVGGQIVEKYITPKSRGCEMLGDEPFVWDQNEYVMEVRECSGKPYSTYVKRRAPGGRYKVELCYGKAFNFDWDAPGCTPMQNMAPTCVETDFWIR